MTEYFTVLQVWEHKMGEDAASSQSREQGDSQRQNGFSAVQVGGVGHL